MLGELQKRPYDICHLLSRVSPLDSKITFSYKWLKSRAQLVTHRIFVSTIYLVETTLTEIRRDSKPKCIIHIQKWLDPFKQTKIPSDHFRVSLYVAGFSPQLFSESVSWIWINWIDNFGNLACFKFLITFDHVSDVSSVYIYFDKACLSNLEIK